MIGFMPTTHKSLQAHMAKLSDDELVELCKRYQKLGSMCAKEKHHRFMSQAEQRKAKVA